MAPPSNAPMITETAPNMPHNIGKLSRAEFVGIIAAMMGMNSLSIDAMLPALPQIGAALHVLHGNDRQWVVTAYPLGLGIGSLIFGPISDRYGRRITALASIALFMLATLSCALTNSFTWLLLSRVLAGIFAASTRVVPVSIVRDCFEGDAMARILSLIFMVFMIAPILAPSFGQAVLLILSWRWIFGALLMLAAALWVWIWLRLPETLTSDRCAPIDPRAMAQMFGRVLRHRSSLGYMITSGIAMAGSVAYIASSQQIFTDVFHLPRLFPLAFAGVSATMAVAAFSSSRMVERLGARRLSQGALVAMAVSGALHVALVASGRETVLTFIALQAVGMMCVALTGSNFGAIAMEPFAKGAGLASSIQAFLVAVVSVGLGGMVGAAFDGTTMPIAMGYMLFGLTGLGIVAWAERGRLFTRPHHGGLRAFAEGSSAGLED